MPTTSNITHIGLGLYIDDPTHQWKIHVSRRAIEHLRCLKTLTKSKRERARLDKLIHKEKEIIAREVANGVIEDPNAEVIRKAEAMLEEARQEARQYYAQNSR